MRQFETVEEYINTNFKAGDRIILAGYGILDGLKAVNKSSTYKTVRVKDNGDLVLKAYKGKRELKLPANYYDQQIQILTPEDFRKLN